MPAPAPPSCLPLSDQMNGNGAAQAKAANPESVHATGQPDTPIEVITDLLQRAMSGNSVEEIKGAVQKALAVAGGLDPYLEKVSSKPSEVSAQPHCRRPHLRLSWTFSCNATSLHQVSGLTIHLPTNWQL